MKKQIVVYSFLMTAVIWSSSVLISSANITLSELQGAAEACNCKVCNEETKVFNECLHTNWPADPNGAPPNPDPSDPNEMWKPDYTGCSASYCIKNTLKGAKCPPMVGGADCPMKEDNNLWWDHQEIYNNAAADCASPDYTVVEQREVCTGLWSQSTCITSACGGAGSTKLDPDLYNQDEYRGGDPSEPNNEGRYVCDL